MKLAYYPGCTLHGTAREYDASTKAVCKAAGIELVEIDDWNCCGALEAIFDKELSMGLSARNNFKAQKTGLDLVIPCSICSQIRIRKRTGHFGKKLKRRSVKNIKVSN